MRIPGAVAVSVACVMGVTLAGVMPAFGQANGADELQPGVDTSAMQPADSPATTQPPASAPAAPAAAASGTAHKAAAAARTTSSAAGRPGAPAAAGKSTHPGKALDRIELDTTQITGNKELPKVMYVVPWRHADLGDLTGKPANSLVDEVLQPVDRDVFNREQLYYHTVAPQKSPAAPQAGAVEEH